MLRVGIFLEEVCDGDDGGSGTGVAIISYSISDILTVGYSA